MDCDVLIVGAGPTGLVVACDLIGRGNSVMVVDRLGGPATTSRAIGLQPRGLEILQRLGAADGLCQDAVPAAGSDTYAGGKLVLRLDQRFDGLGPLLIGQQQIEARLRDRLSALGGHMRWEQTLQDLRPDEEGVTAEFDTPQGLRTIRAGWVVGCDGAHSVVRRKMGVGLDGHTFPQTMVLADLQIDWDRPRDRLVSWLHPDGILAAAPLPGGRWRIFAEIGEDDPLNGADRSSGSGADPEQVAIRLGQLFAERAGGVAASLGRPEWESVFRFHQRLVTSYRRGRMLLAGDAAHIHSAQGAQGMNMGIGDAFNLGWKLGLVARGLAEPAILDTYEAERRPVAAEILRRTGRGWRLTLGKSLPLRLARDWLVLPIMALRPVQRRLASEASQMRISYRDGPLAQPSDWTEWFDRAPGSGDRAPDEPCRDPISLSKARLGDLIGARWALLSFLGEEPGKGMALTSLPDALADDLVRIDLAPAPGRPATVAGAARCLEDHTGGLARSFGAAPGVQILIRPDGHVGWRSDGPEGLDSWLRRLSLRASSSIRD